MCMYLIEQSQVKTLCEKAKEILSKESNVQEVRSSGQVSSPGWLIKLIRTMSSGEMPRNCLRRRARPVPRPDGTFPNWRKVSRHKLPFHGRLCRQGLLQRRNGSDLFQHIFHWSKFLQIMLVSDEWCDLFRWRCWSAWKWGLGRESQSSGATTSLVRSLRCFSQAIPTLFIRDHRILILLLDWCTTCPRCTASMTNAWENTAMPMFGSELNKI